jgi:hypothetical protein
VTRRAAVLFRHARPVVPWRRRHVLLQPWWWWGPPPVNDCATRLLVTRRPGPTSCTSACCARARSPRWTAR